MHGGLMQVWIFFPSVYPNH